jgi:uncharacterized protein (TIGR04255 family)
MRAPNGERVIQFSESAVSFHRLKSYPGWSSLGPELQNDIHSVFTLSFADFKIVRLGIRYQNAFTREDHGIGGINDLNLKVTIGGAPVEFPANLNFRREREGMRSLVRIASREMLDNPLPANLTAFMDIDIGTPDDFECGNEKLVHQWFERAHLTLKEEYFSFYTPEMSERLIEA